MEPVVLDIDTSTAPATVDLPTNSAAAHVAARAQRFGRTIHPDAQSPADADEQRFVDEFGFELRGDDQVEQEMRVVRSIDGQQVLRREIKWARMTADWAQTVGRNFDKMKERSRKGIPSKLRGVCWQLQCGSRMQMESPDNQGVYQRLLQKPLPADVEGMIERDLGRTFPTHSLFREVEGVGQTQLRNILHAYAVIDPEVGYVQGMGFVVGTLLTQMGEEEAFWALHALMHHETYRMREMFRPGFPMLQMFFYQLKRLLQKLAPKLADHFNAVGCDVSFFAAQWFLTLFVYHFTFRAVLRVWDVFFCEGWKIVFRVGIALMKWEEAQLMAMPFDELMPKMKNLHEGKAADEILVRALKVKFKTEELLAFRRDYENGDR